MKNLQGSQPRSFREGVLDRGGQEYKHGATCGKQADGPAGHCLN